MLKPRFLVCSWIVLVTVGANKANRISNYTQKWQYLVLAFPSTSTFTINTQIKQEIHILGWPTCMFDIRLALFGLYRHQSNKLKILVLAFLCTSRPYTYLGGQHGITSDTDILVHSFDIRLALFGSYCHQSNP